MTLQELEKIKRANWKICTIKINQKGADELGLPLYETVYIEPPTNYKLIRVLEPLNLAILQDLDYETTN